MRFIRPARFCAFTIVELLMVIAIMAVVAGLVVGLNNVAGAKKKILRTEVERDRLVTLIEAYKAKIGVYPPDNTNDPGRNTLLYELAGGIRITDPPYSAADPNYVTSFGGVRGSTLTNQFGIGGMINAYSTNNASDDPTDFKRFLKNLSSDQAAAVAPNTLSLVVPVDGPNGRPNPWKYLIGTTNKIGTNIIHNPETFDLWVDIVVGGQTRTIGNWKE